MKTTAKNQFKRRLCLVSILMFFPAVLPANAELFDIGFFEHKEAVELKNKRIFLLQEKNRHPVELKDFLKEGSFLLPKNGYYSEAENFRKCNERIGGLEICDLTSSLSTKTHNKKVSLFSLQKERIREHLKKYTDKVRREPLDGRFEMTEEGKLAILRKSRPGIELDIEATLQKILDNAKEGPEEIDFSFSETAPKISTKNISDLGIEELIGHGESNFRGSPKNRIHNIKVAVEKFQGLVLKPGDEFSFTTILGPVEASTGYKEELVIKQNKTIPEFGGGVCQVSTTMFRAALNTGLKITERQNHAYPVQYYAPQGTDATIYIPKPDFRFINDSPAHILIQAKIEGTILALDFFGTSDGRKIEIEGPKVTERTADGKLKTILYQIISDGDGNLIRKDTFKSFYDNPAKYHEPEFKTKPDDWSNKQWDQYKQQHGI